MLRSCSLHWQHLSSSFRYISHRSLAWKQGQWMPSPATVDQFFRLGMRGEVSAGHWFFPTHCGLSSNTILHRKNEIIIFVLNLLRILLKKWWTGAYSTCTESVVCQGGWPAMVCHIRMLGFSNWPLGGRDGAWWSWQQVLERAVSGFGSPGRWVVAWC